jgi:hypothetical protein
VMRQARRDHAGLAAHPIHPKNKPRFRELEPLLIRPELHADQGLAGAIQVSEGLNLQRSGPPCKKGRARPGGSPPLLLLQASATAAPGQGLLVRLALWKEHAAAC